MPTPHPHPPSPLRHYSFVIVSSFVIRHSSFLLILLLTTSCTPRTPPLPHHPLLSPEDTRLALAQRAHSIRTISAEARLTLTRPGGDSVRLDAAVVLQPPTHARVRAWKFGQAVFDLTLSDQGLYLLSPDASSRAAEIRSAGLSAAQLARTWSLLTGSFFDAPALATIRGDELELRRTIDNQTVRCTIHRPTLTPQKYTLTDPTGTERFSLTLSDYRLLPLNPQSDIRPPQSSIPFPHRLIAKSDTGTIDLTLSNPELNTTLPPAAFTPPRRAEKVP